MVAGPTTPVKGCIPVHRFQLSNENSNEKCRPGEQVKVAFGVDRFWAGMIINKNTSQITDSFIKSCHFLPPEDRVGAICIVL